jgi:thiazole synthase ThiGH ThiG subunit
MKITTSQLKRMIKESIEKYQLKEDARVSVLVDADIQKASQYLASKVVAAAPQAGIDANQLNAAVGAGGLANAIAEAIKTTIEKSTSSLVQPKKDWGAKRGAPV